MAFQGLPDKDGDRHAWERAWTRRLALHYSPSSSRPRFLDSPGARHLLDTVGLDEQNAYNMLRIREAICEVQSDLAETAVKALAQDDFEKQWTSLSKKARAKLILDGIHHACCASGDMERRREWCPDVTVEAFEAGGGRGYLRMLKLLLPIDSVSRTSSEPLIVPHPAVDALFGMTPTEAQNPAYKHQVESFRIMRMYFISLAVLNIILGFYGASETYTRPAKSRTSRDVSKKLFQATRAVVGEDIAKEWIQDFRDISKDQRSVCHFCEKAPTEGKNLKRCSKCNPLGRVVHYCSKECQQADWKRGRNGRTHKQICGKPLQESLRMDEGDSSNETGDGLPPVVDIPPPAPGFRRSAALLHQLTFLVKPPYVNYVFMRPAPLDDMGVTIPDICDQAEFLFMRRRALYNADPAAVHIMYAMLLPFSSIFRISPDQLCQQLEREYELRIDLDADLPMDPGTLEERKRALLSVCLAQMARMPPHERPLWRDRMLQLANDRSSFGVRDSVNGNGAAATREMSPQTHQSAYISEVEREPQQRGSSSSLRNVKENSPQYSHMPPIDHASLNDRHISLASPAPTTPHKNTHLQSRGIILTLFFSTFVVLATLMTALMVVARFLTKLLAVAFRTVKEFKRRTQVRYPIWKVYIDAAFIGAGLVAPLLIVLL